MSNFASGGSMHYSGSMNCMFGNWHQVILGFLMFFESSNGEFYLLRAVSWGVVLHCTPNLLESRPSFYTVKLCC